MRLSRSRSSSKGASGMNAGRIARAEVFVEENLVAAAQIRHDRGVTSKGKAYFHEVTLPSDPAVIDALVRGSSELLILLDGMSGEALGAAA